MASRGQRRAPGGAGSGFIGFGAFASAAAPSAPDSPSSETHTHTHAHTHAHTHEGAHTPTHEYAPASSEPVYNGSDSDLRACMRKLAKRDVTTKLKALQELSELIRSRDKTVLKELLPAWAYAYLSLVLHNDRRVRAAANGIIADLAAAGLRKSFLPFLPQMLPHGWMCAHDPAREVAAAATKAFEQLFGDREKCMDALVTFGAQISSTCTGDLRRVPEELSDMRVSSKEEAEERAERVHAGALVALTGLLRVIRTGDAFGASAAIAEVSVALSDDAAAQPLEAASSSAVASASKDSGAALTGARLAIWRHVKGVLGERHLWKQLGSSSAGIRRAAYGLLDEVTVTAPQVICDTISFAVHDGASAIVTLLPKKAFAMAVLSRMPVDGSAANAGSMWRAVLRFLQSFPSVWYEVTADLQAADIALLSAAAARHSQALGALDETLGEPSKREWPAEDVLAGFRTAVLSLLTHAGFGAAEPLAHALPQLAAYLPQRVLLWRAKSDDAAGKRKGAGSTSPLVHDVLHAAWSAMAATGDETVSPASQAELIHGIADTAVVALANLTRTMTAGTSGTGSAAYNEAVKVASVLPALLYIGLGLRPSLPEDTAENPAASDVAAMVHSMMGALPRALLPTSEDACCDAVVQSMARLDALAARRAAAGASGGLTELVQAFLAPAMVQPLQSALVSAHEVHSRPLAVVERVARWCTECASGAGAESLAARVTAAMRAWVDSNTQRTLERVTDPAELLMFSEVFAALHPSPSGAAAPVDADAMEVHPVIAAAVASCIRAGALPAAALAALSNFVAVAFGLHGARLDTLRALMQAPASHRLMHAVDAALSLHDADAWLRSSAPTAVLDGLASVWRVIVTAALARSKEEYDPGLQQVMVAVWLAGWQQIGTGKGPEDCDLAALCSAVHSAISIPATIFQAAFRATLAPLLQDFATAAVQCVAAAPVAVDALAMKARAASPALRMLVSLHQSSANTDSVCAALALLRDVLTALLTLHVLLRLVATADASSSAKSEATACIAGVYESIDDLVAVMSSHAGLHAIISEEADKLVARTVEAMMERVRSVASTDLHAHASLAALYAVKALQLVRASRVARNHLLESLGFCAPWSTNASADASRAVAAMQILTTALLHADERTLLDAAASACPTLEASALEDAAAELQCSPDITDAALRLLQRVWLPLRFIAFAAVQLTFARHACDRADSPACARAQNVVHRVLARAFPPLLRYALPADALVRDAIFQLHGWMADDDASTDVATWAKEIDMGLHVCEQALHHANLQLAVGGIAPVVWMLVTTAVMRGVTAPDCRSNYTAHVIEQSLCLPAASLCHHHTPWDSKQSLLHVSARAVAAVELQNCGSPGLSVVDAPPAISTAPSLSPQARESTHKIITALLSPSSSMLAEHFGITRAYLSGIFTHEPGLAPHDALKTTIAQAFAQLHAATRRLGEHGAFDIAPGSPSGAADVSRLWWWASPVTLPESERPRLGAAVADYRAAARRATAAIDLTGLLPDEVQASGFVDDMLSMSMRMLSIATPPDIADAACIVEVFVEWFALAASVLAAAAGTNPPAPAAQDDMWLPLLPVAQSVLLSAVAVSLQAWTGCAESIAAAAQSAAIFIASRSSAHSYLPEGTLLWTAVVAAALSVAKGNLMAGAGLMLRCAAALSYADGWADLQAARRVQDAVTWMFGELLRVQSNEATTNTPDIDASTHLCWRILEDSVVHAGAVPTVQCQDDAVQPVQAALAALAGLLIRATQLTRDASNPRAAEVAGTAETLEAPATNAIERGRSDEESSGVGSWLSRGASLLAGLLGPSAADSEAARIATNEATPAGSGEAATTASGRAASAANDGLDAFEYASKCVQDAHDALFVRGTAPDEATIDLESTVQEVAAAGVSFLPALLALSIADSGAKATFLRTVGAACDAHDAVFTTSDLARCNAYLRGVLAILLHAAVLPPVAREALATAILRPQTATAEAASPRLVSASSHARSEASLLSTLRACLRFESAAGSMLHADDVREWHELRSLVHSCLRRFASVFPARFRDCWNDLERPLQVDVEKLISARGISRGIFSVETLQITAQSSGLTASRLMCLDIPMAAGADTVSLDGKTLDFAALEMEAAVVLARERGSTAPLQDDGLRLTVDATMRSVIAVFRRDEATVALRITFPLAFPLRRPEIVCEQRMGVSEQKWRRWELQMMSLLTVQNGTILQALRMWRDNITKEFEGVEPCPICYSVINTSNMSLPRVACPTCKNKFHGSCLYTWFATSHDSKCPMCRQYIR